MSRADPDPRDPANMRGTLTSMRSASAFRTSGMGKKSMRSTATSDFSGSGARGAMGASSSFFGSSTDAIGDEFDAGYARFAPNSVPLEVPERDEDTVIPQWERYNWYCGEVRFEDPARRPRGANTPMEDKKAKVAEKRNAHFASLLRANPPPKPRLPRELMEGAEDEGSSLGLPGSAGELELAIPDGIGAVGTVESAGSILTVKKYPGKEWIPVWGREEEGGERKVLYWQNNKGRRMRNDVPRFFGPVALHE